MKNYKLFEIIEINEDDQKSLLIELMVPYKRSLVTYFEDYFCTNDLILMVTSVTNATSYGKIVPASDFYDAVCAYLQVDYIDEEDTESDIFGYYETICANSLPLNNL